MRKFLSLFALVLLTIACEKEDITGNLPPEVTPPVAIAPEILAFSVSAPDTTIKAGSVVDFFVKIRKDTVSQPTISWVLDEDTIANAEITPISFEKAGVYTITCLVQNSVGKASRTVKVTVKSFIGGFFVVNEGQFGTKAGTINHFDPITKELTVNAYEGLNSEQTFGMSTCFGTEFDGKFYFVSKQGNRLVQADGLSLKHQATLSELGGDGRSFVGIDENRGVVTTSNGAFLVNLNPLSIGQKITDATDRQCGALYATQEYLFIISQVNGIKVYDITKNFEQVKAYGKGSVGFTVDKNGDLWAAASSKLLKIDTKTLEMEEISLPGGVTIYDSWGAWNCGSLCASPTENALFFTKGGMWGGGNEIYKYKIGDPASLNNTFIQSSDVDDYFYGSGIGIDPKTGDIVATFVKNDYTGNRLVIFDPQTGQEKLRYTFEGYYFPAMIIFNN